MGARFTTLSNNMKQELPHVVELPRLPSTDVFHEIREWLESDENTTCGLYTRYASIDVENRRVPYVFRFSDEMTALYFKMRYG